MRRLSILLPLAIIGAWPAIAGTADSPTSCAPGPAVLATISGLRAPTGLLVVYLYGDRPGDFLEHARSIQRVELPVHSLEPVFVCLRAPGAGRYAVSVRHDVDGNRRRFDMNDGGGFSRNPRLSLAAPRPRLDEVLIDVGPGVVSVEVVLNYRYGLSIRPVRRRTPSQ